MKRRLFYVSFLLSFILPIGLLAQVSPCHLSLKGVVKDAESGEGLPGATVYIRDLKTGISSGVDGRFLMENLCPGVYEVEIRYLGYLTEVRNMEVTHDAEVEVTLRSEAISLNELVVEGHKEEILNAQPVISLGVDELEKSAGQSLASTLGTISGVNMLQTGSTIAKPVIHGMHSNRVLLLVNGIRHEGQQWGLEHAPEIDPFMASEMTVIKGAAAVQYGPDAIGGVVLISPPTLPKQAGISGVLHSVGESNGRSGTFSGELQGGSKNLNGFGWRVQGTLKKAGNLKAPDYYLSNTGVEEMNFSTALGYSNEQWGTELFFSNFNTELGILSASHVGNLTDLENALERGDPFDKDSAEFSYSIGRPFQKVNHAILTSRSFYKFNPELQLHASYGFQVNHREEYDRARQSIIDSGEPQLDFELTTHSLDVHLDHRLFGILSGSAGVMGQQQSNTFDGRQLIPNFRSYNAGVYLIEHYIKNKYELEAGFRYDYKYLETFRNESGVILRDELEFSNFSTVLGGIYQFNQEHSIRLNLSTAWRPPSINELYSDGVHQGVASYELGDPNLDSERALNTSISYNLSHSRISGEFTVYYHNIKDFIYLEPQYPETVLTIRGAFPLFEYKQVDARFTGMDLDFLFKLSRNVDWRIKGSLVRASDLTNDDHLIWIPSDRIENEIVYNFPAFGRWSSSYAGVEMVNVREQTLYPENTDFDLPPDGYTLVNLKAGSDFELGENILGMHFEVSNLFNTSYRDYMNRFRYFADEPGINFILRINYKF